MKIIIDKEPKNRKQLKQYCKEIGIKQIVISIYNPTANDVIKMGHMSIANIFSKLTDNMETN